MRGWFLRSTQQFGTNRMSNDGAAAFTTGQLNDTHTVFGPQLTAMTNLTLTTQNMRRTKQNKQLIQSLKAVFFWQCDVTWQTTWTTPEFPGGVRNKPVRRLNFQKKTPKHPWEFGHLCAVVVCLSRGNPTPQEWRKKCVLPHSSAAPICGGDTHTNTLARHTQKVAPVCIVRACHGVRAQRGNARDCGNAFFQPRPRVKKKKLTIQTLKKGLIDFASLLFPRNLSLTSRSPPTALSKRALTQPVVKKVNINVTKLQKIIVLLCISNRSCGNLSNLLKCLWRMYLNYKKKRKRLRARASSTCAIAVFFVCVWSEWFVTDTHTRTCRQVGGGTQLFRLSPLHTC